ncbi:MAG: 50S ribosomal protein L24 [Nocardioidaceae bacterium]
MATKRARNLTIKKGDVVRVIAGTDKGAEGKVIGVYTDQNRLLVEGVNRVKRHTKVVNTGGRAGNTGGIITQEAPIHASNVMLLTEVDGKKVPTRVGSKRTEVPRTRPDGTAYTAHRNVRIATKNGEEI